LPINPARSRVLVYDPVVPAHDRCNLLSVVATMVGVLEHVVVASDLSLQVNAAPADGGQ
jgi:hypothetical protein